MNKITQRAKVVLTNLLTYLVAAQTILTVAVTELDFLPWVVRYGALALTGLATAISFIRRVTPVLVPEFVGLLPPSEEEVLRDRGFDPEKFVVAHMDRTGVYLSALPKEVVEAQQLLKEAAQHLPRAEEVGGETPGYV